MFEIAVLFWHFEIEYFCGAPGILMENVGNVLLNEKRQLTGRLTAGLSPKATTLMVYLQVSCLVLMLCCLDFFQKKGSQEEIVMCVESLRANGKIWTLKTWLMQKVMLVMSV